MLLTTITTAKLNDATAASHYASADKCGVTTAHGDQSDKLDLDDINYTDATATATAAPAQEDAIESAPSLTRAASVAVTSNCPTRSDTSVATTTQKSGWTAALRALHPRLLAMCTDTRAASTLDRSSTDETAAANEGESIQHSKHWKASSKLLDNR